MCMWIGRRLMIVVLTAIIVTATAACGGTPTAIPPTATPVPPTATLTPVPATATTVAVAPAPAAVPGSTAVVAGNPVNAAERELVGAAFANLSEATSFAMTVKAEGTVATVASGDIIMEIVQTPARSIRMKVGDQLEMIVIGQDAYIKAGATPWQKSSMPPEQLQQLEDSLNFAGSIKPEDLAKIQMNKLGSEKLNGVETDVFSVTVSVPQPQITRVWISRTDKRLVQQSIEDQGNRLLISFYGWNAVTIEAPKL